MLSITNENLRRIIWEEVQLLTEITFASAVNNLGAKKMRKAIRRWLEEHPRGVKSFAAGRTIDELTPEEEAEFIQEMVGTLKSWLLDIVPDDLEDNQKGLAVTWLARLARDDETGYLGAFLEGHYPGSTEPWGDFEMFFHYQQFMGERDLNKIRDLEALAQVVAAARPQIEEYQAGKDYGDVSKGTEVFRDDDEWFIAALHNKGAACSFGKGTDWCTAAPGLNYFEDYYEENDPLFYFENRDLDAAWQTEKWAYPPPTDAPRFQFHYGSQQFMTEADQPVSEHWFKKLHGLLMQTEAVEKYPILTEWTRARLLHTESDATPEQLQEVVDEPDVKYPDLLKVAEHPNTTEEILRQLIRRTGGRVPDYVGGGAPALSSRHSSTGLALKSKVGEHPNTTPELMGELVDATLESLDAHSEERKDAYQGRGMSVKFFSPLLTRLVYQKTINNEDMKRLAEIVDSKMLDDFIKVKLMAREEGEEPSAFDIRKRVINSMQFAEPETREEEMMRPWHPHISPELEETYLRWKKIID